MILKDINQIRCFLSIYQMKSLTKAAKKMHISKAAMAKKLAQLEVELGYRLFRRSTRQITPTPEGDKLFSEAQRLMDHVQEFEASFTRDEKMHGVIRVTCSTTMAQDFVAKTLSNFQHKYPEVKIELIATDSMLDMIENNIDLAVRVNPVATATSYGRKIGSHRLVLVASPKYLKEHKKIRQLSDLKEHQMFFLTNHGEATFKSNRVKVKNLAPERDFITNDPGVLNGLALNHQGISLRPWWNVKDLVENNKLEVVLKKESFDPVGEVWVLSSVGRMQTQRVRTLFDELVTSLSPYFE